MEQQSPDQERSLYLGGLARDAGRLLPERAQRRQFSGIGRPPALRRTSADTVTMIETRSEGVWPDTCLTEAVMRSATKSVDQTEEYRSALMAERARIMGGNQRDRDILVFPGGVAVEDQAPLMHDQFVAIRQHRMDLRKLKLIDAALERLNGGEFGTCDDCGERIPGKRLKAVPWAAYCVPCQDRMDTRQEAEAAHVLEMIA
jgi:RNA polymerase-binding transcription factor DksA